MHFFVVFAVQEGVAYVNMSKRPLAGSSNCENSVNGRCLDHGTVHEVIVEVGVLMEAFGYQVGLIPLKTVVGAFFNLENSPIAHNIHRL